jgi:hypothetical protein
VDSSDLDTIREHRPAWWWTLVARNRCRSCKGRWPCGHWHYAHEARGRRLAQAAADFAAARMLEHLRQQAEDAIHTLGRAR